jgi:hypothetical protein
MFIKTKQKIQIKVIERKETHVLCGVHVFPCLMVYEKIKQERATTLELFGVNFLLSWLLL